MEAKKRDMGVVGSTQNILDFIAAKVKDAVQRPFPDTLQVLLSQAGVLLSVVVSVQADEVGATTTHLCCHATRYRATPGISC